MAVLAQHGFGSGSKISEAINRGYIDGCIFSPRDLPLEKMKEKIAKLDGTTIFFDPQYYAAMVAQEPEAKLGCLVSDYGAYFSGKNIRELRREKNVGEVAEKVLTFQKDNLNLANIIAPNIVIQDGLNSASSNISKTFLEICSEKSRGIGLNAETFLTLALDQSCFRDSQNLIDFVDEITGLGLEAKGFYILVETTKENGANPWFVPEILAGQMYLAYALSQNGYEVMFGYSFLPAPYLWAAGASGVASGWYNTLRYFSLNKYRDSKSMARKANRRYFSNCLWQPIEWTQVQSFNALINLMNGFETDLLYTHPSEEKRPNETDEALQYWETLKRKEQELSKITTIEKKVEFLLNNLKQQTIALTNFKRIGRLPYSEETIRNCQRSLSLFVDLAELSLSI